MKIVTFDIAQWSGQEARRSLLSDAMPDYWNRVEAQAAMGPAFSLLDDRDELVASGGVVIPWRGVGEAWTLCTPRVQRYVLSYCHAVRRFLGVVEEKEHLHRVQAIIPSGDESLARWMQHVGLDYEATLEAYGPTGDDVDLYARVRRRTA
ncbi:hypothetical protein dsx2_2645 [Desulfovibrio sp. X2]|uniref:hypothetical protein n=1 Tax=Desulfovibrio sp. X2 TaxID=941449 RepID=UPI000358C7B5|nr:hypothetical protein [Desulfovibrio sp. X2]EPR42728.1 hypothetical protein dsx2_2645 [Desulfovibrio sp. X2]